MADIIGTASVVVRAITTGLQKDIEDGFEKGVGDAQPSINKTMEESGRESEKARSKGMRDQMDKDTDRNTKHFTDKFNKSLTKRLRGIFSGIKIPLIAWAGLLAVPALGGAVKLIGTYLAGIVAQLGFVVTAAIGGGAAVGGAFAGIVAAIAPLFIFLKRKTPELEAFQEMIKNIGKQFEPLAKAVQREVLPAIITFAQLLTDAFLPAITDLATKSAESVRTFLGIAGAVLTSATNVQHLNRFFESSNRIFDIFLRIVLRLIDTLIPLLDAVSPLAERFLISIEKIVTNFQNLIKRTSASGKLSETLTDWYDRAQQFMRALGDITVAIVNVFLVGAEVAQPFFDTLSRNAREWRRFTESAFGREQIKTFFENAIPVVQAVNRLLRDVIDLILSPILEGDTGGIVSFVETLRTDMLPVLAELASVLAENLDDALITLAESFTELIRALAESGALHTFLTVLSDLFIILEKLLSLPGMSTFLTTMFALSAGLTALNIATLGFSSKALAGIVRVLFAMAAPGLATGLGGFAGSIVEAGGGLTGFSKALVPVLGSLKAFLAVLAPLLVFVATFVIVWKNWDTIAALFQRLSTPLKVFVAALGALAVALALLFGGPITIAIASAAALVVAIKNWSSIVEFIKKLPGIFAAAGGAIIRFFTRLPELIGDAVGAIGEFAGELPGLIVGFFQRLPSMLARVLPVLAKFGARVAGVILGAFTGLASLAGEALAGLGEAILDALANLPSLLLNLGRTLMSALQQGIEFAIAGLIALFIGLPLVLIIRFRGAIGRFVTAGAEMIGRLIIGIVQAVPRLLGFFLTLPGRILTALARVTTLLVGLGIRIITSLVQGLVAAVPAVLNFFTELPGNIIDAVSDLVPQLLNFGGGMITAIIDGLIDFLPELIDWFVDLPGNIIEAVGDIGEAFFDIGGDIIQGLLDGLIAAGGAIWSWIQDTIGGVVDKLKGFLGISSPSTVFAGIGGDIIQGLINGAVALASGLFRLFTTLPQKILSAIVAGAPVIFNWFSGLIGRFVGLITAGVPRLINFFTSIPGRIVRGIIAGAGALWNWWDNLVDDIKRRVQIAAPRLLNFFTELPGNILNAITGAATAIFNWFGDLPQKILDKVTEGMSLFKSIGESIGGWIKDALELALEGIADILKAPINAVIEVLNDFKIGIPKFHIKGTPFDVGGGEFDPFDIPKLAGGGTALAGMPHWIGELGPEIFIPNRTGTVISNSESKNLITAEQPSTEDIAQLNESVRLLTATIARVVPAALRPIHIDARDTVSGAARARMMAYELAWEAAKSP